MLRKADEHLATQRQFEAEAQAKLFSARQRRQEEKERQEALEVSTLVQSLPGHFSSSKQREKVEELRQQAEKLAEERRIAREQALEWTTSFREESDEEKEKKVRRAAKKEKVKTEGGSGDEAGETKKKRRPKAKKGEDDENAEDQALFSDQEDGDKPIKKVRPDCCAVFLDGSLTSIYSHIAGHQEACDTRRR
jgi:RNA polymerase-associated protein CTR9